MAELRAAFSAYVLRPLSRCDLLINFACLGGVEFACRCLIDCEIVGLTFSLHHHAAIVGDFTCDCGACDGASRRPNNMQCDLASQWVG